MGELGEGRVRVGRRHVLFVPAFDVDDARTRHATMRRELERWRRLGVRQVALGEPEATADPWRTAWTLEAKDEDGARKTRFEVLGWEEFVQAELARPFAAFARHELASFAAAVADGAFRRHAAIWRRSAALFMLPAAALVTTFFLPPLVGAATGRLVGSWIAGGLVAVAAFLWLARISGRGPLLALANGWLSGRDWTGGRHPRVDERVEAFARRLVEVMRDEACDEILLVAHSGGGALAVVAAARALELDPDLVRRRPRLALLGLGTPLAMIFVHSHATALRAAVARLAREPGLLWVDCAAGKDLVAFPGCDPAASVPPPRANPVAWSFRVREVLSPERYDRYRRNLLRLHYQYVMANDRPADYDWFEVLTGPRLLAERFGRD